MDISGFKFDFAFYVKRFQEEAEKIVKERVEKFNNENQNISQLEILQYESYQWSRMAIDVSANVMNQYHLQLMKYLESK